MTRWLEGHVHVSMSTPFLRQSLSPKSIQGKLMICSTPNSNLEIGPYTFTHNRTFSHLSPHANSLSPSPRIGCHLLSHTHEPIPPCKTDPPLSHLGPSVSSPPLPHTSFSCSKAHPCGLSFPYCMPRDSFCPLYSLEDFLKPTISLCVSWLQPKTPKESSKLSRKLLPKLSWFSLTTHGSKAKKWSKVVSLTHS